ncbi:hypothetical protein L209DRAFT_611544 [Thermothelomyces heterothallicus CBS 203.75]
MSILILLAAETATPARGEALTMHAALKAPGYLHRYAFQRQLDANAPLCSSGSEEVRAVCTHAQMRTAITRLPPVGQSATLLEQKGRSCGSGYLP